MLVLQKLVAVEEDGSQRGSQAIGRQLGFVVAVFCFFINILLSIIRVCFGSCCFMDCLSRSYPRVCPNLRLYDKSFSARVFGM